MNEHVAEPIARILNQTLGMTGSAPVPQERSAQESSLNAAKSSSVDRGKEESKRRTWLDKWLGLKTDHHPQLRDLEFEVYGFCAAYAKKPSQGYRLIIYGNNGAGKSHTGRAIHRWASRLAIDLPWVMGEAGPRLSEAAMVNWPRFVDRLKSDNWDLADEYVGKDMLIIDDLGAEHDPSKVGIEKLYWILEKRERRWTVITTNLLIEEWESKFEKRIASRLARNSRTVSVENVPDYSKLLI